jgi:hypothetical protein
MENAATPNGFRRPFPALTPAQRYHLDVYGSVIDISQGAILCISIWSSRRSTS